MMRWARWKHTAAAAASSVAGAKPAAAAAATTTTSSRGPRKHFKPHEIYPHKPGHVRICNNTTRDAQQSNLSAEMAHVHRMEVAKLIDDCYAKTQGPPGVEQIYGGTVPMFDLWKRGVHPFDELREMTALLPNTATSMLVRSNSLTSMQSQPRDVVDAFIKACADGGIDVSVKSHATHGVSAEPVP
jgi:pyruvate carboxylase